MVFSKNIEIRLREIIGIMDTGIEIKANPMSTHLANGESVFRDSIKDSRCLIERGIIRRIKGI